MTDRNGSGKHVLATILAVAALASLLFWRAAVRPGGRLAELVAARAIAKEGGVRIFYRVDFGRAMTVPAFAKLPEPVRMEAAANALRDRLRQIDARGVVSAGAGAGDLIVALPGTDAAEIARVRGALDGTASLDGREGGLRVSWRGEEKVAARR